MRILSNRIALAALATVLACSTQAQTPAPGTLDKVRDSGKIVIGVRESSAPMAYLLGHREFMGHRFQVTPDVLIPRPDSETLIEVAIDIARERGAGWPRAILDLGTGPGTLLLAALDVFRGATGLGVRTIANLLTAE